VHSFWLLWPKPFAPVSSSSCTERNRDNSTLQENDSWNSYILRASAIGQFTDAEFSAHNVDESWIYQLKSGSVVLVIECFISFFLFFFLSLFSVFFLILIFLPFHCFFPTYCFSVLTFFLLTFLSLFLLSSFIFLLPSYLPVSFLFISSLRYSFPSFLPFYSIHSVFLYFHEMSENLVPYLDSKRVFLEYEAGVWLSVALKIANLRVINYIIYIMYPRNSKYPTHFMKNEETVSWNLVLKELINSKQIYNCRSMFDNMKQILALCSNIVENQNELLTPVTRNVIRNVSKLNSVLFCSSI
jgi:hypothetical protein